MPLNAVQRGRIKQSESSFDESAKENLVDIQWDPADKAFVLSTAVFLPRTRTELFDFFSDAFQLEKITPNWLNFRILTPAPIAMKNGCLIDYKISLRGLPMRWKTEISSWDPPFSFTDRQLKGPYLLWEHLHTFEEAPDGTLMSDRVRYRVFGGRLINWAFVQDDLRKIFSYRARRMLELFPSVDATASANGMAANLAEQSSAEKPAGSARSSQIDNQRSLKDSDKGSGVHS